MVNCSRIKLISPRICVRLLYATSSRTVSTNSLKSRRVYVHHDRLMTSLSKDTADPTQFSRKSEMSRFAHRYSIIYRLSLTESSRSPCTALPAAVDSARLHRVHSVSRARELQSHDLVRLSSVVRFESYACSCAVPYTHINSSAGFSADEIV